MKKQSDCPDVILENGKNCGQPSRDAWKNLYMYCLKNIYPRMSDEKKREILNKRKRKEVG